MTPLWIAIPAAVILCAAGGTVVVYGVYRAVEQVIDGRGWLRYPEALLWLAFGVTGLYACETVAAVIVVRAVLE